MKKQIKNNVFWIGALDPDIKKFHGDDFTIHSGSSQNAYLIEEEKKVLVDTVWAPHFQEFVDNLKRETDINTIDYIIVNHGESDHSGALPALMELIPDTPIYCTANAVKSLEGQYGKRGWNFNVVKTGDSLDIGNGRSLIFVEMKFLHWPDAMAEFLTVDNILFSMDAFGQHYLVPEMFDDCADQERLWSEALRYYANIVGPFSPLVKRKIAEIRSMNLPIEIIAPSHGAVWRKEPLKIIEAYASWSDKYAEDRVSVIYATEWRGTEKIAYAVAEEIKKQSPSTAVNVFNVDETPKDDIIADVFRSKAVAVGCPTILNGVVSGIEGFLYYLKSLRYEGKKAAVFGCYGWSGEGNRILKEKLAEAGFSVVESEVKSLFNPENEDFEKIPPMVSELIN